MATELQPLAFSRKQAVIERSAWALSPSRTLDEWVIQTVDLHMASAIAAGVAHPVVAAVADTLSH
jgi:hypothetical protein